MPNARTNVAQTQACERPKRLVKINPLLYRRWDSLLEAHPGSSFFHRTAWAQVLHETYGHLPIYFCRFADGLLKELFPIMEISSPWTGRRGVSLPFTDVCLPLHTTKHDRRSLYELAMEHGWRQNWRSLECRSNDPEWEDASPSLAFYGHVIDLKRGQAGLFKSFDGAVRRGILKAVKAGVRVEFSNSLDSIRTFYGLHCVTRRRHGLPPQPIRFFENVARYVLGQGHGVVATARWEDKPLAAGVFFHHGRDAFYKFGASDYAFQQLRPTTLSSGKLSSDMSTTDLTPCIWAGHRLRTKVCGVLNSGSEPGRRESSTTSTILSGRHLSGRPITARHVSGPCSVVCRCRLFGSPVKCFTRICLS